MPFSPCVVNLGFKMTSAMQHLLSALIPVVAFDPQNTADSRQQTSVNIITHMYIPLLQYSLSNHVLDAP